MTPAQITALSNPCLLAAETMHERFGSRSGAWSTILTVNTGYEWLEAGYGGPVWHVSIAYHGRLANVGSELEERARRALRGVGDATLGEWTEGHGPYFHLRRRLSDRERSDTGMVMRDIRGTAEAEERSAPFRHRLPAGFTE